MGRTWSAWAPLPLRLALGFGFMYHGFPKVFSAQEHQGFVATLQSLGVPAPSVMAWLVGGLEFFGGLALILGAFVGLVSMLLVIDMLVAIFKVHLPNGFSFLHITGMTDAGPTFGMPGYEPPLLYVAGLLVLILGGAGALSVDGSRAVGQQHRGGG